MIIPVFRFFHRSTLVALQIIAGAVIGLLFMSGLLFWKLSHGPVDITFAADTVKSLLVSVDHEKDLQFDSIVAEWPEFKGPISVGLSGVRLIENGKPVLAVPQLGIRIAKAPLFIGLIYPEAVVAKNATLKLYRAKTGGVHLFLSDMASGGETSSVPATSAQDTTSLGLKEIGEAFFKGGTLADYHELTPLAHLERFSIDDAHVIIVDDVTGKGLNVPKLNIDLWRKRTEFKLAVSYQEGAASPTNISFLIHKNDETDTIDFDTSLSHVNASSLVNMFYPQESGFGAKFLMDGQVRGHLDQNWILQNVQGDITSQDGKLDVTGGMDTPLTLSDIQARVAFDRQSGKVVLYDTHAIINGRRIDLAGEKIAEDAHSVFGLKIGIPEISFDDIQSLWPKNQRESLAAEWLTKNLSKAKIKDAHIVVPIDLKASDAIDPTKIEAGFTFENLTADYRAPLIPVTAAKGSATLKDDVLLVKVDAGKMADLDVEKGSVEITHLTHPTIVGDVTIHANLAGRVATVLDYIGREPINLGDKVGLKPDQVKGSTSLQAKVVFPALKDLPADNVRVEVDATLKDILLPSIVHGLDLTGGPYNLTVKGGAVTIAGQGALGGKAIDLTYMQAINLAASDYLSKIKAKITTDAALRTKFGVNLDQFVAGDVPVTLDYTEAKTKDETIGIVADVTPAVVMFSPFKYRKPMGVRGQATCTVTTHNGEVQKISDLKMTIDKDGDATGSILFGKVGGVQDVKSGKFSSFTLAGANNFALDFIQTSPNVFDISIQGKQLDGRPFLNGGDTRKGDVSSKISGKENGEVAVTAKVSVAQIKTGNAPDQMLLKPTLALQTNPAGDVKFLDLSGQIKGGTLMVSLKPDAQGKMQLKIASDNAGSALHTLDLYDQLIGGKLDVVGSQMEGRGMNDIGGKAQITNFTVVRAPVLAKLINLFSLSGLTELLQNKGIEFEKLKTQFEWKNTASSGRVIALQNGRTSGASIGLTFGGNIYQDTGTMDISGTFVPISQINGWVNQIPLIGNLLTGGKNGGVIAATYAMKGKSDDPSVFINPLSVLTPGFLRSILFENNSSIFDDNADEKPAPKSIKKRLNN